MTIKNAKRGRKIALFAITAPFLLIALYLAAATLGAFIPANDQVVNNFTRGEKARANIFLVSTLLHVDIAIPVTPQIREKFQFLENDGFPLANPNLAYLVIGWGSREFYTQTKNYSDISLITTLKAVVGDTSVMHIIPSSDLEPLNRFRKISLPHHAIAKMADTMLASFKRKKNGSPLLLIGKNHGVGDLFYEAKGNFNILQPCNVWAAKMLRSAGLKTGIWTPTTYSLMWSLDVRTNSKERLR